MDVVVTKAEPLLWLLHLSATAVMTGVIWVVQRAHYPAFRHDRPPGSRQLDPHRRRPTITC